MRRIRLGRTERQVPAVSLGTWAFGGSRTVDGLEVGWSGHDDRNAVAALERAFELGIDHWDTADVYGDGQSERLIATLWGKVPRDRIFLASKVGFDPGPYGHAYHPRQISERLDRSLRYLATDRIDLYYLHRCEFGPEDRYLDDAGEALRRAREQGKIRFTGLSDWDSAKLQRYARHLDPDVVQPYRNVAEDIYGASALGRWVEERDVGVAFFSPLRHGLLLGKYERPATFPRGDVRNRVPEFRDPERIAHYRRCRDEVARRFPDHPQPVLRALVGALLVDTPSACVLLGMRDAGQAEMGAAAGDPLTSEEAAWVRALYSG